MSTLAIPLTLSDVVPVRRWRTATLVVGGALLTTAAAQVRIPLGFTPVPLTGQTFAVLLVGATLGARRAAASQTLYWVMALIGLPVLSNGQGGWSVATGATAGYVVGFIAPRHSSAICPSAVRIAPSPPRSRRCCSVQSSST